ncbi:hypothetical protein [Ectothiorhodospira variabilis]|uniref:hypothetical protein n=1 Tax=Ectothiorhodospira variabilis TaxID=505694 RepID=UPI001EFA55F2|nr:hypothetical protein [Ectothiorhodospira variabilis]MCG5496097.1 hypothetical protein [Ectothiorhodospira variabilis]
MPNFSRTKLASFFIAHAEPIDRCIEWPFHRSKEREDEFKSLAKGIESLTSRALKKQGIQQDVELTWKNAVEEEQRVTRTLQLIYDPDVVGPEQIEDLKWLVDSTLTQLVDTMNQAHAILGVDASTAELVKGETFRIDKSKNAIIMPLGPLTILKAIRKAQSKKIGVELSDGEKCELDVPPIHPPVEEPDKTFQLVGALVNGLRDTSMCVSIKPAGNKAELKLAFSPEHRQLLIQSQASFTPISVRYIPIISYADGRKKPIGGSILDVQVDPRHGDQTTLSFGQN